MTDRQRQVFFKLFAKACAVQGISPAARESYRHELIARACPASGGSLKCVGAGAPFEALMLLLGREAQSLDAASHFATATHRRLAKMVEAQVRQIGELTQVPKGADPLRYLQGVLTQAGWAWALASAKSQEWWLDLPEPHLSKLLAILDTHRRRLIKRHPIRLERLGDGTERPMRLAFNIACAYRFDPAGTLWRIWREEATKPKLAHKKPHKIKSPALA